MRETLLPFSRNGVMAGIAFAGLAFVGTAQAELNISKQLNTPMTKTGENTYRVDFYMRVLNTDAAAVSGIIIKDTVKTDFETVSGASVSLREAPAFVTLTDGGKDSVTSGSLNADFLSAADGTILTGAILQPDDFMVIRYSLDVDFGANSGPFETNSTVWEEATKRDTSNNGEIPTNHSGYPSNDLALADAPTTIYFPTYDGTGYASACDDGNGRFESSYELAINGNFSTRHGTPGQLETVLAPGTLLAGSFTSGAQYAGDGAYPHDDLVGDWTGAQISIRDDIALHSNTAQQHPFPGDSARPFVAQGDGWLFFNGNQTGNPVDVWKQTLELKSGKTYNFSMYVSNAAWPGSEGSEHPQIQLFAGGNTVDAQIDLSLDSGSDEWKLIQGTFDAPADSVEIKITNNQSAHFYNNLAITGIGLHRCALPGEDTDGDGLDDDVENILGTNPDSDDTDGDGLKDGAEVGNPASPADTDGDGKIDALESSINDVDGDGIKDQVDSDDSDGPLADIDNDGLTNGQEDTLGTDKTKADTDGDEENDLAEVGSDLANPLNADGDCHIDALDSAKTDSDGDGQVDEFDFDPACNAKSGGGSGGGGGAAGFGLLALSALPMLMRRRRKDA